MTCIAKEPWSNLTTTSKCSTPCLFNHAVNGTGVFGVGFFAMFVSMIQRAELEEQLSQHPLVVHTATQLRTAWPEGCEIPKPNSTMDFRHISGNVRERIKREAENGHVETVSHSANTAAAHRSNAVRMAHVAVGRVEFQCASRELVRATAATTMADMGALQRFFGALRRFERQGIFSYAGHLFQRFKLRRMFAMAQEREFMYGFPRNTLAQSGFQNPRGCQSEKRRNGILRSGQDSSCRRCV